MSPKTNRQRCQSPGCKAWARRGQGHCAAHQASSQALSADVIRAAEGLRTLARARSLAALDDQSVIEGELRQLCAARMVLAEWVEELAKRGWEGCSPAQFLRAWSDSARQVAQLVRARRELSMAGEGDALDEAYAVLESYPGIRLIAGRAAEKEGQQ